MSFAFEVHPTEISYDNHSTERALEIIGRRGAFGFNFDPSPLYWQFVDQYEPANARANCGGNN